MTDIIPTQKFYRNFSAVMQMIIINFISLVCLLFLQFQSTKLFEFIFTLVMFVLLLIWSIRKYPTLKLPLVTIDNQGLTLIGNNIVHWQTIKTISLRGNILGVMLKEGTEYNLSFTQKLNRRFRFPAISIILKNMDDIQKQPLLSALKKIASQYNYNTDFKF